MAGHRKFVAMLAARRAAAADASAFTEELVESLKYVMAIGQRDPGAERVVRLCGALAARRVQGEEEDADAFCENFLAFLVSVARAQDKAVRFRAAQLISTVMNALDEEAELSDELYEDVRAAMLARLRDRHPPVRAQAVRALARLQEPGDEGDFEGDEVTSEYRRLLRTDRHRDVRKAVLASIAVADATLDAVVERVRDIDDGVRRVAFMVLAAKATPKALSIAQRAAVVRHGLGDRAPAARSAAVALLRTAWLEKHCQGDVMKLLAMLDVETYPEVAETVVTELYSSGVLDVEGLADASKAEGGLAFIASAHADAGGEVQQAPLSPEAALYWRVVTLLLHRDGHARGSDAARAGGGGGVQAVAAAAAERLLETLEGVMPSASADLFALAQVCSAAGARFQAAQLLALTPAADVSDATCQRAGAALVRTMLAAEPPTAGGPGGALRCSEEQRSLDLAVANAAAHLGAPAEQSAMILEAADTLAAAHGLYPEAEEDAAEVAGVEAWVHLRCAWLTELAASCLPPNPNARGALPEGLETAKKRFALTALRRPEAFCRAAGARALGAALLLGANTTAWASSAAALLDALRDGSRVVRAAAARPLMDACLLYTPAALDRLLVASADSTDDDLPASRRALLEELAAGLASSIDEDDDDDGLPPGDAQGHAGELQAVTAEGFAKLLLWGRIPAELSPHKVLGGLVLLYFDTGTAQLPRLRQCLAVLFEAFAGASGAHARVAADAFLPAARAAAAGGARHGGQVCRFAAGLVRPAAGCGTPNGNNGAGARLALHLAREVAAVPAVAATKAHRQACARALGGALAAPGANVPPAGLRQALEAAAESAGADKVIKKEVATALAALDKALETESDAGDDQDPSSGVDADVDANAAMASHAEEAIAALEAALGVTLAGEVAAKRRSSGRSSKQRSSRGSSVNYAEADTDDESDDEAVESEGEGGVAGLVDSEMAEAEEGEAVSDDELEVAVAPAKKGSKKTAPARATRKSARATRAALAENQVA